LVSHHQLFVILIESTFFFSQNLRAKYINLYVMTLLIYQNVLI